MNLLKELEQSALGIVVVIKLNYCFILEFTLDLIDLIDRGGLSMIL